MSKPITITATVATWVSAGYQQRDLYTSLEKGDNLGAVNNLVFYGAPSRDKFGEYIRVGEADITVRLIPKDEQTRLLVKVLQDKLDEERSKWLQRQQAILAEISKLQAIEYVEAA